MKPVPTVFTDSLKRRRDIISSAICIIYIPFVAPNLPVRCVSLYLPLADFTGTAMIRIRHGGAYHSSLYRVPTSDSMCVCASFFSPIRSYLSIIHHHSVCPYIIRTAGHTSISCPTVHIPAGKWCFVSCAHRYRARDGNNVYSVKDLSYIRTFLYFIFGALQKQA